VPTTRRPGRSRAHRAGAFRTLIRRLRRHFPSYQEFARQLQVPPSQLSRGAPFDVRRCLRLALLTGESPTTILRAANKGDVAALIEQVYGAAAPQISKPDQHLIDVFARLSPDNRAKLTLFAEYIADADTAATTRPASPRRRASGRA